MSQVPSEFTRLLTQAQAGDEVASKELFPIVYAALRELARNQMSQERGNHTLQPTALVHEAYLKLMGGKQIVYQGRAHFFRAAAQAMRRILIDHARAKGSAKRGGKLRARSLNEYDVAFKADSADILAIDDAITRLFEQDTVAGDLVKLRFYAGLNVEETAAVLGLSVRTVMREWAFARAWLFRELAEES